MFKAALIVMSLALAAFGVLGWAHAARGFDAYRAQSWAALDPIWPVYAMAAIACLAAQFIAACAVVNFARLTHSSLIWRALAVAFYLVAVFFAAYSADEGAKVIMGSAHRAAYEANQSERARLETEIAGLTATIAEERARLPADTGLTYASRQDSALAIFEAATAAARGRLPEVQRELRDLPLVAREQVSAWQSQAFVFLIFLAWAVLEPWGYALAERGRYVAAARNAYATPDATPSAARVAVPQRFAAPGLLARTAALLSVAPCGAMAAPQETPIAPENQSVIVLSPDMSPRAVAFSLRGRASTRVIGKTVGVHSSTVSRWFIARDRAVAAMAQKAA